MEGHLRLKLFPEKKCFGTLGIELCMAVLLDMHVEKKNVIFLETFLEASLITYPIIINS